MVKVIGQLGCSNCLIVKMTLEKKGVNFTYQLISELSDTERNELFNKAELANKASMPMILKNDEFVDISEL